MDILIAAAALLIGIAIGALLGIFFARAKNAASYAAAVEKASRAEDMENRAKDLAEEVTALKEKNAETLATLTAHEESAKEKLALLDDARSKLGDTFKALSSDALKSNNESFLTLARENLEKARTEAKGDLDERRKAIENMVKPVEERLKEFDEHVRTMEKERTKSYAELATRTKTIIESVEKLDLETGNLVKALRRPQVRGRWGETTLKRVAELAGMVEHCDFSLQESVGDGADGRLRPDMVVKLPGSRRIIVDAKTPLDAYLDAEEAATREERETRLEKHADQVKARLKELSGKKYWEHFDETPLFVVMFLPGETFLAAAVERRPHIIEQGFEKNVVIATPSTLISLLLTIAHGWRQDTLEKHAMEIRDLGRELYDRLLTFAGHFKKLEKSLTNSVETFNKAVGSLESRVLIPARKFKELGAVPSGEIAEIGEIDVRPRSLQSPEAEE